MLVMQVVIVMQADTCDTVYCNISEECSGVNRVDPVFDIEKGLI